MDANLMHISYEAGILEDPNVTPPDRMWLMTTDPIKAPDQPDIVTISFESGLPTCVTHNNTKVRVFFWYKSKNYSLQNLFF